MAKPPSGPGAPVSLLRVQIVLSKYKGDKKLSSLPYTLSVSTDQMGQLRVNADVPYVNTTFVQVKPAAGAGEKPAQSMASHTYRTVGTSIDCTATPLGEGAFKLDITVNDSSMSPKEPDASGPDVPTFRSFRVTNSLVLKDGQSGQLTSATDPVTAETLRVDVSMTVLK
jgi:type II secretory pathway component GspD/PulD (secretin)